MPVEPAAGTNKTDGNGPKGRDEIRTAVLDAAGRLFADRRPSQVSIREVAELAGVNHALVHRHFETKDNLVREVLDRTDARLSLRWEGFPDAEEVVSFLLGHRELYQQALLILEGAVVDGVPEAPPSRLLRGLVERLETRGFRETEAGRVAVVAVTLLLGWATYGDWLCSAARLTSEQNSVESAIGSTLHEMLRGDVV